MEIVTDAIDQHNPIAKPCPYAKRWWNEDLSLLRKAYSRLRNQMSRRRQDGEIFSSQLDAQAWEVKKLYFKAIRCQKKKHWEDFLNDNDNIWQTSKYLSNDKMNSAFVPISGLTTLDNKYIVRNDEIAATLLAKFFQPLPPYPSPLIDTIYSQLETTPLTEKEVEEAIFQAKPLKAAGHDRIPALVWQKTWPILKDFLVPLFRASLQRGELPTSWKITKILPLRKPNKGNYASPGAYRPISLLPTLSKAMEYLVAQKIAHLCDCHSLLPGNHFGGLKCKNTLDALILLQEKKEKIYQAWRDKKVLSLITFDVQEAFNGVARDVLLHRLRKRRIPEVIARWIENFVRIDKLLFQSMAIHLG